MKTLFLATAAVAALVAAPAFAQDSVGSIGAGYNNVKYDFGGADFTQETGKIDGNFAVPVTADWTVTVDGGFSYAYNGPEGADNSNVDATVHASTVFNGVRVGGFVGGQTVFDETMWTFGAEAQTHMNNLVLTGSVAYETLDGIDVDAWAFGADAAYFITPALRVNGGLGWSTVDAGGIDIDSWSANVGGEYQIASTPFSVVANYGYSELNDVDVSNNTLTLGVRYSFGGDLQARSRAGADLGRTVPTSSALLGVF